MEQANPCFAAADVARAIVDGAQASVVLLSVSSARRSLHPMAGVFVGMQQGRFNITIGVDGWMMGHLSSGLSPLTHAGCNAAPAPFGWPAM